MSRAAEMGRWREERETQERFVGRGGQILAEEVWAKSEEGSRETAQR